MIEFESWAQTAFSMAVAAFLLIRLEKKMDELTKAIYLMNKCLKGNRNG